MSERVSVRELRNNVSELLRRVERGEHVTVPTSEEGRLRAEINRIGFYSVIAAEDEFQRMQDDSAFLTKAFTRAIAEQVEVAP